ncbi:MAG TPA: heavy metal-binding domain-containing protein [Saprospiraceae bacterium]|jgi:hypothetical protein|nr:heavy metal-binding domain-containing protein [Saprospiraceae bacterium]
MKNQFISFFLMLGILVVLASCGSKNNNQQTEPSTNEHMAMDTTGVSQPVAAHYQCPMKCEGEKTYDKPGPCPVCKMDLKEKGEHEGHEH